MTVINIDRREVPVTARNGRIYKIVGANISTSSGTSGGGVDYSKLTLNTLPLFDGTGLINSPITVTSTKVLIDRDLEVTGNITASKDVVAYVASAVQSDVLNNLTATAPLRKSSSSNLILEYNTNHFTVNGGLLNAKTGSAYGIAELDSNGKLLSSQLPSYVDDVLEVTNYATLPVTGESGKIYITIDTNISYRWTGSGYAEISSSIALGETSATAYRGDRGAIAYSHSQSSHAYLPLTGGTLTGALNGANANFTGNVGVGTSTPSALFQIGERFKFGYDGVLRWGVTANAGILTWDDFLATMGGQAGNDLSLIANGGEAIRVLSSNKNVGIGTATPTEKLEVAGNAKAQSFKIKNASGVTKWTITIDANDNLEFRNASNVLEAKLTQAGDLSAKGEITAYATI